MSVPASVSLPLPALACRDVLAEPVTIKGYTLYPEGWALSEQELKSLQEWGVTTVKIYVDPKIEGINKIGSTGPKRRWCDKFGFWV